jgi:tetratricopeptide (TPR) repeat protein
LKARAVILCSLLVLATLAAYWPVRNAAFTNFDDPLYVTNNPHVFRGLTADGLAWAFTSLHAANWHPLTWVSHMLDCQWFGENAGAHHLVNVSLHMLNALLLFYFLLKATGAFNRSAWVAAVFALHPLHVESVAWISERKDVLSTFFFLLTLVAWRRRNSEFRIPNSELRSTSDLRPLSTDLWYWGALLLFVLGLMCKPMLVTLPFVLILLDYWPLRRFSDRAGFGRMVLEKWPFFLLAAASCVVTFLAQSKGGAVVRMEHTSLGARSLNAGISYVEYLVKCFWPVNLGPFYPFPREIVLGEGLGAIGLLVAITAACIWQRRGRLYLLMGWLWFLGTLVPVIGLVQVGGQALADRYMYIPSIGILIGVAWGVADVLSRLRLGRAVGLALAGGTAASCGLATWVQAHYWRDSISLFERALAVSPENNTLALHNLAHAYALAGNQQEAVRLYTECLRLAPDYAQAHYNLGNTLGMMGKLDDAMAHFYQAIRYKPDYEQAYYNLGNAFAQLGKLPEAQSNFTAALRYKPDYAEAFVRLGNTLELLGEADAATTSYLRALAIRPDLAEAHYYLAGMRARQRQFADAKHHFHAALKANPTYANALNDLAWIQATEAEPNVPEAIRLSTRACELTRYSNAGYLDTLGVALSQAGRFAEAIDVTERAVLKAEAMGDARVTAEIGRHLDNYRAGKASPTRPEPKP